MIKDCSEGEDEVNDHCQNKPCSSREFRCTSGQCIVTHRKCDGLYNCQDLSDEQECSHSETQLQIGAIPTFCASVIISNVYEQ